MTTETTTVLPPKKPSGQQGHGTPAPSSFQLIESLGVGTYGTAYRATKRPEGPQVEVRRLRDAVTDRQREDLQVRLRLNTLLHHPVARSARDEATAEEGSCVVLDAPADASLGEFLAAEEASLERLAGLLSSVVLCVVDAHGLGLSHGGLGPQSIGLRDGKPRIDFTGFHTNQSDDPLAVGSPEAKAADARAMAGLVQSAIVQSDRFADCRADRPRESARLKQLCAAIADVGNDGFDLSMLAECLDALVPAGRDKPSSASPGLDTTNELSSIPSVVSDSTSEIVMRPVVSNDSTAELGLAGPMPGPKPKAHKELQAGDQIGRYRIDRKLGQGGMGAVFKAIDLGTEQPVAIKVLSEAAMTRGNAVQRFEKEARLLASVNNPYVTNLIEVSTEGSQRFIVLEFVDGCDVKHLLDNQGPLKEATALSIVADVARALVDAHQREIVHRDIKPENILLVDVRDNDTLGETPPAAKLTDFGIARHVDQSESLAVTQAGSLLGTPIYMSPEQCKGTGEVLPPSDVYSLGITLFELLTGNPPFIADDPMALAGMHCFDAPPSILKLRPELSEPTAEIIAKCLAKRPADRYADAAHLLTELDRLLRGEASAVALRPVMPEHDAASVVGTEMSLNLKATPEALWPYVANTERLNRAIGLPPVTYRNETDENGTLRRFGSIRLAGFTMSWEEHPFEWIEGRRMSVLREFDSGPFRWFVSTVELVRLPEGGTELTHSVRILPRNFFGRLIAKVETGSKCRRSLNTVYTRIDEVLNQQVADKGLNDAFEKPVKLKRSQREALIERLGNLKRAGADHDTADRLGEYLMSAPDQSVTKIRPIALAQQLELEEATVIDTCLSAVVHGLLKIQWDILCPTCRVAADTRDSLKQLTAHTNCEACNYDFKSSLADSVELIFCANSDIRETEVGRYCIGGPWHAPHVVAQARLEPGERLELELALGDGDYLLRGPRLSQSFGLHVQPTGAPSQQLFVLTTDTDSSRSFKLRHGKQLLTVENQFDCQQIVRIERTISRDDVVTAARASALPRFRELFPGEVLDSGRLVSADQVTLLTATIASIDNLYEELGDEEAFGHVEQHLSDVESIVREHRGEVVKVIGETSVASFHDPRQAVRAAFAIRDAFSCEESHRLTAPAVGVHRGPALVTTANNRLDYFGATARQATALPAATGPGVALTENVFSDVEVAEVLSDIGEHAELETIQLPGKSGQIIQRFLLR